MRYFTADLHFGHYNIIKYCNRPFDNAVASEAYKKRRNKIPLSDDENKAITVAVNKMNDFLIGKINSAVNKDDTLFVIGDVAMQFKVGVEFLKKMNCKVILVVGNHDSDPDEYKKEGIEAYREISIEIEGTSLKLNHYPILDDPYSKGFQKYMPTDDSILLHGHSHSKHLKRMSPNGFPMIDVGIDYNFSVFSENEIISILKNPEIFMTGRLSS